MTHETKAGMSGEKDSGFSEAQVPEITHTNPNSIWIHTTEPMVNFLMWTACLGGSDKESSSPHVSINKWCQIGKGGAPNRQGMLDCGNRECL